MFLLLTKPLLIKYVKVNRYQVIDGIYRSAGITLKMYTRSSLVFLQCVIRPLVTPIIIYEHDVLYHFVITYTYYIQLSAESR